MNNPKNPNLDRPSANPVTEIAASQPKTDTAEKSVDAPVQEAASNEQPAAADPAVDSTAK